MIINNKTIIKINKKSPAKKAGLKVGDIVLSVNGEPILDFVDDNYFSSLEELEIEFIRKDKNHYVLIQKDEQETLGISYKEDLYPTYKQCVNACTFCFVDQLPGSMRESLYIKDDDWRYSVLFGNYVTLTNVDDDELKRIVKRGASPLYVSVHAINGQIRNDIMRSKKADKIKSQLKYLSDNKIIVHTQVVLCPGTNDGAVLKETIEHLYSLYPYVRTLAVVPVGLTQHRDNLSELKPVDMEKAKEIINLIEGYNKKFQADKQVNFVFASDEFYSIAKLPYPVFDTGEHYPQLSNGVGMFSELTNEFNDALKTYENQIKAVNSSAKIISVTGVSAHGKISQMIYRIKSMATNLNIQTIAIINKRFGESITVAGLLCGSDIVNQLKNVPCNVIIVPASTLRDGQNVFLDDTTVEYIEDELKVKVIVQEIDGYAMIEAILEGVAKG